MNNSLEKLTDDKILTSEDIKKIKAHLENNYQHCSSSDRAKLFSKKITRIVDSNLTEVDDTKRPAIKSNLIKTLIGSEEQQLNNKHLFDEISQYDDHHWQTWVETKYGDVIKKQDLEKYLKQKKRSAAFIKYKALLSKSLGDFRAYTSIIPSKLKLILLLVSILIPTTVYGALNLFDHSTQEVNPLSFQEFSRISMTESLLVDHLAENTHLGTAYDVQGFPHIFSYKAINTAHLETYLFSRNSKLLEDGYLDQLVTISQSEDVCPILLISIIGQEQGFIPIDNQYASEIINNPYNVFGSWQDYNTTFTESTKIAAVSVKNILSSRPVGEDPFLWLNATYAEDPEWHKGVKFFFYKLLDETSS